MEFGIGSKMKDKIGVEKLTTVPDGVDICPVSAGGTDVRIV